MFCPNDVQEFGFRIHMNSAKNILLPVPHARFMKTCSKLRTNYFEILKKNKRIKYLNENTIKKKMFIAEKTKRRIINTL